MLNQPGPVALRAVADAITAIGTKESGPPWNNRGASVDAYLASVGIHPGPSEDGAPWCAGFVEFKVIAAAHELGVSLPVDFPRGTYAAAAANWAAWAKAHGRWFTVDVMKPLKGDLACFDIVSEGGIHHMGFVSTDGTSTGWLGLEGNTNTGSGDPVRDGYCVARRQRTYANLGPGGGFIRLGPW